MSVRTQADLSPLPLTPEAADWLDGPMTRYADPRRCPDCAGPITPGVSSCPTCGLTLTGETAQGLFTTLTRADELLARLRSQSVPAVAVPFTTAPMPVQRPVATRQRARLSAASVPKLLLALGAGCLLVAALVFLAVTWSVMGVGGRTATLVALTAVAGALAAWLARRGLRAAAESLSLVAYGLLTLDVVGADNAGWFGDLSSAGLLVLVGAVLGAAAAAGALSVRRTQIGGLTGAEVVLVIGTALVSVGVALAEWLPSSPSLVVATVVAGGVAVAAHLARLTVAAIGAAVVTGVAWMSLTAEALDRAFAQDSWRGLWLDLEVWPLLVAAALVGLLALVRRVPQPGRVVAAGLAELLVVVAVAAPVHARSITTVVLVAIGVLALVAAAGWALPRAWQLTGAPTQVVFGAGLLSAVGAQAVVAADRLVDQAADLWSGRVADRLPLPGAELPAAWVLPLAVFALLVTLAALAEGSTLVDRAVASVPGLQVSVVALLAGSVVATLALYPVPVWLVVGALLLVAATCTAWSLAGRTDAPLVAAALFLASALVVSLHATWLTAAALGVTLVVTAAVHLRNRSATLSAVAGAVLAAAVGASVWTVGHLLGGDRPWVALAGLVVLAALVLLAPYAPAPWWACDAPVFGRTGLEAGALATAVPLALVGVALAPDPYDATWTAVYLTVVGAAVTVMSLLREDRRQLGWAGGALLALSSWVRLWDVGVTEPEAYTLPSAIALLVVGLLHLRRAPGSSTMTALAPGLSLALVPSLLWVLVEPTGLRSLLLGLGCLVLVLLGSRLGWTAPIALGSTVGCLLVLRLAAPYVGDAVPRWVLIGATGALLIAVGATWERRLLEARHLMDYVRSLR